MGDSFQAPTDASPFAVEAGVSCGFAGPCSEAAEVTKTGRGFGFGLAKMLDTASRFGISGCDGALSGCEERWA